MCIDISKYYIEGKFIGTSGKELNGYYDFINIFSNTEDLHNIVLKINYLLPANVIGMQTFGNLLVSYMSGWYGEKLNPIYILKKEERSNKKRIYGKDLKHGNAFPVYFIDDVISTGSTLNYVFKVLSWYRWLKPEMIISIKNRSLEVLGNKLTEYRGIKIVEINDLED